MDGSRRAVRSTDRAWSAGWSRVQGLVQARADDVVLAAAIFKPNAAGWHELASATGFGQRQLLKARGAYLGERVVLGVTPLHLHALAVFCGCRMSRAVGRWSRGEVVATAVCAMTDHIEPLWPALLISRRDGRDIAELQVLRRDDHAWRVLALLLRGNTSSDR